MTLKYLPSISSIWAQRRIRPSCCIPSLSVLETIGTIGTSATVWNRLRFLDIDGAIASVGELKVRRLERFERLELFERATAHRRAVWRFDEV